MAPELKIKITAAAELSALRSLNDSLEKQVTQAKALGKDYQSLEQDLKRVQKAMAAIKPPSFLQKAGHALKEGIQEMPVIGAISRNFNGATPWMGATLAGIAGVGEGMKVFAEGVVHVAEYAHQMENLSQQTGQTVAQTIEMSQAFRNAGLGTEFVGQAINMFQKALTGVNEEGVPTKHIFDKLGLSVAALKEMAPVEAFALLSEKISGLATPADKTRAAFEMFGRAGGRMLSLLNNPEGFAVAKEQVGKLAETLGASAEELASFTKDLDSMDLKKMQFFAGFAGETAGSLKEAGESIRAWDFTNAGKGLANFVTGFASLSKKFFGDDPILQSIGDGFLAVTRYGELKNTQKQTAETDKKTAELEADLEERRNNPAAEVAHLRSLPGYKDSDKPFDFAEMDAKVAAKLAQEKDLTDAEAKAEREREINALPPLIRAGALERERSDMRQWTNDPSRSDEEKASGKKALLDLDKEMFAVNQKINEESKKSAEADKKDAAKREELDLELAIKEAKASGNDKLAEQLQWQREYNRLLKEYPLTKEGKIDPNAYGKAIRGANAAEAGPPSDPIAEAQKVVHLSSAGRLGMAMGESLHASPVVDKIASMIKVQETQTNLLQKIVTATQKTADKPGGYQ